MQTLEAPVQIISDSSQQLCLEVLHALKNGEEVGSVRDPNSVGSRWGMKDRPTKELRYVTLVLENPRDRILSTSFFSLKDVVPRALLCTLTDTIDLETIGFYNPKVREFSDDGKTITSNYGSRIRRLHGINQIDEIVRLLKKDKNSRRAVIHVHNIGDSEIKYAPCIDSIHFLIRNDLLECHSFWRSENALTLLPTNIFEFTMLQELIATQLDVDVGRYVHTVSSLHYYLEDEDRLLRTIHELSHSSPATPMGRMPEDSLEQLDILKIFEKTIRCKCGDGKKEFSDLSAYWQEIAKIMVRAIRDRIVS